MVHEHRRMWPTMTLREQALEAGPTDTANEMCRTLLDQLAAHNVKEEPIDYPQADELLAGDDLATRFTTEYPCSSESDQTCSSELTSPGDSPRMVR